MHTTVSVSTFKAAMQCEVNYLTSVSSDTVKSGGYYRIMQGLVIPLKSGHVSVPCKHYQRSGRLS